MKDNYCSKCGNTGVEYHPNSDTYIPCSQGCVGDSTEEETLVDLDEEVDHFEDEDHEDLFFPDDFEEED